MVSRSYWCLYTKTSFYSYNNILTPRRTQAQKYSMGCWWRWGRKLEKAKNGKVDPLTIEMCINYTSSDITKLNPGQMAEMKKVFDAKFGPLYSYGDRAFTQKNGTTLRVPLGRLHKAHLGILVYREIQAERLEGIVSPLAFTHCRRPPRLPSGFYLWREGHTERSGGSDVQRKADKSAD